MDPKVRPQAWVNGRFVAIDEATVSIRDRGFLFADAVYEVIPAYDGQPFLLGPHLDRLDRSLAAIALEPPLTRTAWQEIVSRLIDVNGGGDMAIYVQVTRGEMAFRNHRIPADAQPTVIAFCQDLPQVDPAALAGGVQAILRPDERWQRCHIKSTALLANVLHADEAARAGANEAILHRDGLITEGASSNVFAVVDGRLVTPAASPWILSGITREAVLRLMSEMNLAGGEEQLRAADLRRAQEIWLTSATREILAVTRLDGAAVGSGEPGPLCRQMQAELRKQPPWH